MTRKNQQKTRQYSDNSKNDLKFGKKFFNEFRVI